MRLGIHVAHDVRLAGKERPSRVDARNAGFRGVTNIGAIDHQPVRVRVESERRVEALAFEVTSEMDCDSLCRGGSCDVDSRGLGR